ncbi:xylitol dehydrogenase [Phellopilus nigrolimitatus]|nr:xylitol dehydrogenase [Phellopilus nigrolimitatus]
MTWANSGASRAQTLPHISCSDYLDIYPRAESNDVIVEVKKTGICGSAVHLFVAGRLGHVVLEKPMVLGHESSGIVSKVGSKVANVNIGDRVAVEPGATCGRCEYCKGGNYQLCPDVIFPAYPPVDGTLGRFYKLPSHLAYRMPVNLTLEDGAMASSIPCSMEPLSVAVHAVSTVARSLAVGPLGFCAWLLRKLDVVPSRLNFALTYAATDAFLPPPREENEPKIGYARRAATLLKTKLNLEDRGRNSLDYVFEASGAGVCVQIGLLITKIGGTFIQVGNGEAEMQIPITSILVKELDIKGSHRYGPGDYALAISLTSSGKIDLKSLITHRFAFDDAPSAFEAMKAGKGLDGRDVLKVIISGPDVSPFGI